MQKVENRAVFRLSRIRKNIDITTTISEMLSNRGMVVWERFAWR